MAELCRRAEEQGSWQSPAVQCSPLHGRRARGEGEAGLSAGRLLEKESVCDCATISITEQQQDAHRPRLDKRLDLAVTGQQHQQVESAVGQLQLGATT